jgi:hypothetical protein
MPDFALERPPRRARNWFKFAATWLFGAIVDPHRHTTSSARIIAFLMWYSLHRYLVECTVAKLVPDYRIVAILVTGGIVPLVVRTKSTQKPELLLPRPPIVVSSTEQAHG